MSEHTDPLPLCRPSIGPEEIAAVTEVLASGWLTTGRQAAAFEAELAAFCAAPKTTCPPHAVAVSSATAGMHVTLHALGIGPGDEVVTPSLTWVSTVNSIVLTGATPVFADIDPHTLMVSAETIAPCLGPRTRLIVPVHFAGAPLDLDPIRKLAATHNIPLVEDAAHAIGAAYRGQRIGAQGTAIFSFHPIKNITTGEGGMVVSDDASLIERIRRLKFHGLGQDAYDRHTQGRAPQSEVQEPGWKYNLTDLAAALGRTQLRRLPEFIAARGRLAACYRQRLASVPGVRPLALPPWPHQHAWHLFIVRIDPKEAGVDRDTLLQRLQERGIGCGIHFKAVHLQSYYRQRLPQWLGRLPATEQCSEQILSLPLFPAMTEADVNRVAAAIQEATG